MDKSSSRRPLRRINLIVSDRIEAEAYEALKTILESEEYRRSVTEQLVSLARRLDDDDPYNQVAESSA
ncbi:MAG: hypothetical protein AAGJ84_12460 [Pseudomonadota bacterium]